MTDLIQLEVITPEVESQLIGRIKARMESVAEAPDILPGRSKVLRYGWCYDHPEHWIDDIPEWLSDVLWRRVAPFAPNNVTINQYAPGRGITPHIDSAAFGDPIFILSLGSCATMLLHPPQGKPLKMFVPPRSLVVLTGRLRSEYKHSITAERNDTDELGVRHDRKTRWSVVLRKKL